ncbi:MAG TPA: YcxB family protein [Pyrinomonadaceae bacterium]|jgi:YcxB-like protein|nr:YcxB family protein [Pyrinomonadaceae bacterium]
MSHSANEAVQLSFRYSEEEYLAAIRFYFWHSKTLLGRAIVTYVLFSVGLVLLPLAVGFSLPIWANLALVGIAGVALFHGYVVDRPRTYFQGDPKFRDDYYLTFTDAGIEFHTQNMSSMTAWNFYSGVVENDSFYILIYGKNIHSLSIVPKRAFQSSNQDTTFRQILRRNVDPTLKLSNGESDHVPPRLEPPDWR